MSRHRASGRSARPLRIPTALRAVQLTVEDAERVILPPTEPGTVARLVLPSGGTIWHLDAETLDALARRVTRASLDADQPDLADLHAALLAPEHAAASEARTRAQDGEARAVRPGRLAPSVE